MGRAGEGEKGSEFISPALPLSPSPLLPLSLSRPYRWLIAVAVVTLVGYSFYAIRQRAIREAPAAVPAPRRAIAVLGFRNLTQRTDTAWLSTAFAEMLGTELAAGGKLRMIPGENVARRMKLELALPEAESFAPPTLDRIRANLGADLVILGSYSMLGPVGPSADRPLRLDLRLQEAATGELLAAVAEQGTEAQLFDLVARAGARLREQLGVGALSTADNATVQAARPTNAEAARLYSEGLQKLRLFEARAAQELLARAVAADPNYPLVHAALSTAWSGLGYEAQARDEAKRAFDLSANLAREERLVIEGRYRETTKEWERAIEVYRALFGFFSDNLEYGWRLARVQLAASKHQDALATVQSLRRLPPPAANDARLDLIEADVAEATSDFKGEQAAALRAVAKGRARGAQLVLAEALHYEGWTYWNLGDPQKALATYDEARRLFAAAGHRSAEADIMNSAANVLWDQGDLAGAQKIYTEALAIKREVGHRPGIATMTNNLANVLRDQGELAAAQMNLDWDWAGAERAYQRALELNPALAAAHHWYGWLLVVLGRHDESIAALQHALRLDPQSQLTQGFLGSALFFARRFAEALTQAQRAVAVEPQYWMAHWAEACSYERLRQWPEAMAACERALALSDSSMIKATLAMCYAGAGKKQKARQLLAELQQQGGPHFVAPYYLALICAALGETDQAFAWFDAAVQAHDESVPLLKVDPRVDGLRSDPRFADLLRRVGLAQ